MDSAPRDSLSEVRRVRQAMSKAAGHDIRRLIGNINQRQSEVAERIVDHGTKSEQRVSFTNMAQSSP